ncbi:MAG: YidB family protein [Methylococcales bacterium]|nr:YidB family protein [Methylococcales bacterium]
MSMLNTILGTITSETHENGNLLGILTGLISDQQTGGLSGLIEKISANGLGEQAASWVSTGKNLPVTAEQIQAALGSSFVQDIAAKMGVDTNQIAGGLAILLPQVIDSLTPDGQISDDSNVLQSALFGLGGLLGNKSA